MKKMKSLNTKKTLAMTGVTLAGMLALTSCAADIRAAESLPDNRTPISEQSADGAAAFAERYYEEAIDTVDEAQQVNTDFNNIMGTVLATSNYETEPTSSNPYDVVNAMDSASQKKVADTIQEVNPLADYVDFSGLSDPERFMTNVAMISANLMTPDDVENVLIDEDSVNYKENSTEAFVPFDAVTLEYDGDTEDKDGQALNVTGGDHLELVYVDGEWKFNPHPMLEMLNQTMTPMETEDSAGESTASPAPADTVSPSDSGVNDDDSSSAVSPDTPVSNDNTDATMPNPGVGEGVDGDSAPGYVGSNGSVPAEPNIVDPVAPTR